MLKYSVLEKFQLLFVFVFSSYLIVNGITGHPISNPGTFSVTQVSKFPFYQLVANPCGFSKGLASDSSMTTSDPIDDPAFTQEFLTSMLTAINLTKGALDNVKDAIKDTPGCAGISLSSLPVTPPLESMNELNTMRSVYKSGIYLVAHLHIVSLDREGVDYLNQVSDYDLTQNEQYFQCSNEPKSFVETVNDLTRRLENILCTVISGANLKQRASFRSQLEMLEGTKIFRYHSSCSSLQMRDCIVFWEVDRVIKNLDAKFSQLISQTSQRKRLTKTHVKRRSTTMMSPSDHHHLPEIDNNI